MANAIYPKWKEAVIQHLADSELSLGNVVAVLVDTGVYTYSPAHEFVSSLSGVVGTPQLIIATTYVDGVFDGGDLTIPAVTGATCEAIVIYIDTGVAATSRLFAYIDTGVTGLPVTPNGGDIGIEWNVLGIVAL